MRTRHIYGDGEVNELHHLNVLYFQSKGKKRIKQEKSAEVSKHSILE